MMVSLILGIMEHSNEPILLILLSWSVALQYIIVDIFADTDGLAFEPPLKNWDRAIELIDHLQITVAPAVFTPRAVYDGRANLFAPRQLSFPSNSAKGTVGLVQKSSCFTLRLTVLKFTIGRREITISPVAEIDCK